MVNNFGPAYRLALIRSLHCLSHYLVLSARLRLIVILMNLIAFAGTSTIVYSTGLLILPYACWSQRKFNWHRYISSLEKSSVPVSLEISDQSWISTLKSSLVFANNIFGEGIEASFDYFWLHPCRMYTTISFYSYGRRVGHLSYKYCKWHVCANLLARLHQIK